MNMTKPQCGWFWGIFGRQQGGGESPPCEIPGKPGEGEGVGVKGNSTVPKTNPGTKIRLDKKVGKR